MQTRAENDVRQRAEDWSAGLRRLSRQACVETACPYSPDVVRFYLARWCQKAAGQDRPEMARFGEGELSDVARGIARHLAEAGAQVERLVAGDAGAWTELRRELVASAARTAGAHAAEHADEALQRIALVLLTGTSPAAPPAQLGREIAGPSNEYVFRSPFGFWARAVVRNLIADEHRRRARAVTPPAAAAARTKPLDRERLRQAQAALPGLLGAIDELPPAQRAVFAWSLSRRDVDDVALAHLRRLAPELFAEAVGRRPGSDSEIAELLGSTPRRVAANRSAARRKLAGQDPLWALLLDVLLPHRSTRGGGSGE